MSKMFEPFPVLECPRLILEKLSSDDAEQIAQMRSEPQNAVYLKRNTTMSREEAIEWIDRIVKGMEAHTCLQWVIRLRSTRAFVGNICLWNFTNDKKQAEIGYELRPEYRGKGYMSEALEAVLELADRHELTAVDAYTHYGNRASINILMRHFFKWQNGMTDADNADNVIYRKTFHQKAREDQPEED